MSPSSSPNPFPILFALYQVSASSSGGENSSYRSGDKEPVESQDEWEWDDGFSNDRQQGTARPAPSHAASASSSSSSPRGRGEESPVVGLFSMGLGRNRTMPVTRAEYEAVPEWKLHCLLSEHGLPAPIKGQLLGGCF